MCWILAGEEGESHVGDMALVGSTLQPESLQSTDIADIMEGAGQLKSRGPHRGQECFGVGQAAE